MIPDLSIGHHAAATRGRTLISRVLGNVWTVLCLAVAVLASLMIEAAVISNPDTQSNWFSCAAFLVAVLTVIGAGTMGSFGRRLLSRPYNGPEWSGSGDC